MSKRNDPTAEGSVAPENMPSKETNTSGKPSYDPTAERSAAPENTMPEIEEVITSDTGPVTVGIYTFPSKKVTGNAAERQRQIQEYKDECIRKVIGSYWVPPKEMAGDLLKGYFNGAISQEEYEQLALKYMEEHGKYNDPDSHTEKRRAVRASVIAC